MSGPPGRPPGESPRLLALFRPGTRDAVNWEIRHHIEERVDRLLARGWDPVEARREAERLFGDARRMRGELIRIGRTREGRRMGMDLIDTTAQDVRHAVRGLRRAPGFAAALVLTLGLGIGANTAIFSVVDALLMRPLPYAHADRLVEAGLVINQDFTLPWLPAEQAEPWRAGADFLEATALHARVALVRMDRSGPEVLAGVGVSHDLDDLLGARMALGRGFTPDDARVGAERVVVLTHGYWREIGSPSDILGTDVRLDGELHTVVGVLEDAFKFPVPGRHHVWVPLAADLTAAGHSIGRLEVVGRLPEDVPLAAAQERADALAEGLQAEMPQARGWSVRLKSAVAWRANTDVERASWMLAVAVALILMIATVNAVNLLLVKAAARRDEMAMRAAIGASRGRLARQLLTEGVVTALLAAVMATSLAALVVTGVGAILPSELRWSSVYDFSVEGRALAFTFVLATGVGLVLGILPAAFGLRARPATGRTRAASGGLGRLTHALVAGEVALAVALLISAGLFARSFVSLVGVDPGFEPDGLLFVDLSLSDVRYPTGADRIAFFSSLEERLRALPGVAGVVRADGLPPGAGFSFDVSLRAEGGAPPGGQPEWVPMAGAGEGYLDVLGIELLAGRRLAPADRGLRQVLVDRPLADFLWPGGDALGRRFQMDEDGALHTVVGIVEDVKLFGPDDRQGRFDIISALSDTTARSFGSFAIRVASGDPAHLAPAVRSAVADLDPEQPVYEIVTARAALAESIEKPRFLASVMGLLAGLAALLSAVGTYGVTSYVVARRRREMGIRIAIGAPIGRVRRQIFAQGMVWIGLGSAVGVGLAAALDEAARELLVGVAPGDPGTYVFAALSMVAVGALACQLPARRATQVDPREILSAE